MIMLSAAVALAAVPAAHAQIQSGGVNYPGEWWSGEGLKQGDFFSYDLCHVSLNECQPFQIDFWVEGDIFDGSEQKWLVPTVVYDGSFVIPGTMELGKIAPEPTGGSEELVRYRAAFKSSLVWLSAYATSDVGLAGKGPKKFSDVSWGKIANIGGEQILPTSVETRTVPGGTFETVKLSWKTGGYPNYVWILDGFPFPVEASTKTHVASGIPPEEYVFKLLRYEEGVQENPFEGIEPVLPASAREDCRTNYDLESIRKTTSAGLYLIDLKYGPQNPQKGCEIEWFINFKRTVNQEEFLNQVQYDIVVVDENGTPVKSLAQEEGRQKFYSQSGQVHFYKPVEEGPGTVRYAILVYGLDLDYIVPAANERDILYIDIDIEADPGAPEPAPAPPEPAPVRPAPEPEPATVIPSWIKTTAGFWADDLISDDEFVRGIQYLISNDIIQIPPAAQGTGQGQQTIPSWIKTTAGFWADDLISDDEFVRGIQYMISNQIIVLS